MKIQETCLYNTGVLCGGAGERLGEKCANCGWNPECIYRRKQAAKKKPVKKRYRPKTKKYPCQWESAQYYYQLGYKDKGISDKLHVNAKEIRRWRELNGLLENKGPKAKTTRPREYDWVLGMELYKQGCSNKEIALTLGCDKTTVGKWLKKNHLPRNLNGRDWEYARTLYNQGATDSEIAEELGTDYQTVSGWRKRNHLETNGGKAIE